MESFNWYFEAFDLIGKIKQKTLENFIVDYKFPRRNQAEAEKTNLCQDLRGLSVLFYEHWEDKFNCIHAEVSNLERHACNPIFGGDLQYRNRQEFFEILNSDLPKVEKKLNQQFQLDFELET